MTATTLTREIDLGPGIPRVTVEPLSVPVEPTPCPVCDGTGSVPSSQRPASREWDLSCDVCGGTGKIGAPA